MGNVGPFFRACIPSFAYIDDRKRISKRRCYTVYMKQSHTLMALIYVGVTLIAGAVGWMLHSESFQVVFIMLSVLLIAVIHVLLYRWAVNRNAEAMYYRLGQAFKDKNKRDR